MYRLIIAAPDGAMYRLARGAEKLLDPVCQQAVVDHPGGPLLVLAGPGTGKTTTLVEWVVDRIERRGATPDSILVLTFSRRAAADLRSRITGGLGRTVVTPMAMTFHGFCYALVRRFADRIGQGRRRLRRAGPAAHRAGAGVPGPRDALGQPGDGSGLIGRSPSTAPSAPGRSPPRCGRCWPGRGSWAWTPRTSSRPARRPGAPEWVSVGEFFDEYLDVLDAEGVLDYAELVHRCRILLTEPDVVATLRAEIGAVFVDEYQDTDPSQVRLLQVDRR